MTDDRSQAAAADDVPRRPRPARRKKPSPVPVAVGSVAAFLGLFSFLAFQLRAGHDPALGKPKPVAAAPATHKRVVVVKRIHRRVIVTRVLPPLAQPSAPAQVAPAPTPSAPVVVQNAPTPAPAPAPVVTRSS